MEHVQLVLDSSLVVGAHDQLELFDFMYSSEGDVHVNDTEEENHSEIQHKNMGVD